MSTPSISEIAATLRVQYGINSVRQMEQITTELLVNMPTTGAIGELDGDGDPTGLVVPQFSGQLFHDTTNDTYYRSTGTDSSDWVVIGGGASVQDMQVSWTPTNVKFGEKTGFVGGGDMGVTTIVFSGSTSISGFSYDGNPTLQTVSFPNLVDIDPDESVFGGLFFDSNSALTSLSAPLLESVGGDLYASTSTLLTTLNLASLVSVGGDLQVFDDPVLLSLSAPNLETVGNDLICSGNTAMTSVNLSSLVSSGGQVDIFSLPNVTSINLSSLQTVGGILGFDHCPLLTTLDLSTVTSVGAQLIGTDCTNLATVNISSLASVGNILLAGCALNVATVNAILARLVAIPTYGAGKTVTLNGGTSAAPAGQGVADKATLQGRGATVNTN